MMRDMKNDFLNILRLLIKTPSVVGNEKPFIRLLQRECESLGLKTTEYEGLLEIYSEEKVSENELILSSHIDRHGLICTGPNEFQYAAFSAKHGANLDGTSISEKQLKSIEKRFIDHNVIAYEPWSGTYIGQSKITDSYICEHQNNLIFKMGPIEGVTPGIPLGYNDVLEIDENWISGQLDNVFSIAVILLMYKKGFKGRALFTCEEEAGKSWLYLQSYFRKKRVTTDRMLVLDTSPFSSKGEAQKIDVVLRNRDVTEQFNTTFTKYIEDKCIAHNAHYIKKDEYIKDPSNIGRTELGRLIQGTKGKITGTTFQFPTINYHTVDEKYELGSFKKNMEILIDILNI